VKVQELDERVLREAQRRSSRLLAVVDPFLAAAHEKFAEKPHLIALLDPDARVIRVSADARAEQEGRSYNLFEGASWAEKDLGCNGGGTALATAKPVVLIGPEHLVDGYLGWTCIGVPIRGSDGTVVGALDWSVPNDSVELWSWGWFLGLARAVEEHLRAGVTPDQQTAATTVEELQNPFNIVRGVLELVGSSVGLPTHARLLRDAKATVDAAELALQQSMRESTELAQQLAAANERLLVASALANQRAQDADLARADADRHARELRDADRTKDEFLATLSHELRNPLAPIRNAIYILNHAEPASENARRARTVIERQTTHLTRIVDDLLDVTRIARGKVELRRERVDLADVVRRAVEDHRSVLVERRLRVFVSYPDESVWVDADATRLAQVVTNLLQNAAKFTPAGGEVAVSVLTGNGGAEIRVRDTGTGIEPELLGRVFDRFVQSDRAVTRGHGGLGLGLALVKGIIELHGGTVRAESAGLDQGSEFILSLPVVACAPVEDVPVARRARGARTRHVLVVDHDPDAAETLARVIEMLGHTAEVAFDGRGAVERARANPPDLVLCEVGLPGMNGHDVARALRSAGMEQAQLVAVTAYAQPEDLKQAIDAGFDRHIAKPADLAEIERLLA
jgi:signal transduction histidine kinase